MEGGFNQRRARASVEKWVYETIDTIRAGILANSAVLCAFTSSGAPREFVADLLESTTGEPYTKESLRAYADRNYLLRYAFNLRAGHTPAANRLPERIVQQMEKSDPRWTDDWPLAIPAFYQTLGFDQAGYPTPETLHSAGLDDIAADAASWNR